MRRSSSTWRSSAALLLVLAARPAAAGALGCLPPVFDGGQRLHPATSPTVFWLEPLLRQHELCWRTAPGPDEVRILLAGNSAVQGFPLPVEETAGYRVNQTFVRRGVSAHVFNVAFVNTYQLRDAVIIHEALRYRPDVVVYPLTLEHFVHWAPLAFATVNQFFLMNRAAVLALAAEQPDGLTEPLEAYRRMLARAAGPAPFVNLREAGTFVRSAVRIHAGAVGARLGIALPAATTEGRQTQYDCDRTETEYRDRFMDWQDWNILAWLAGLRATRGLEVVIVNWPIAHDPVDTCYNVRYPAPAVAQYDAWLRAETTARGLRYVDLHALLPPERFLDSVHVTTEGQAEIADRLVDALLPVVAEVAARRGDGGR